MRSDDDRRERRIRFRSRLAPVLALAVLCAGCGGTEPATELSIDVTRAQSDTLEFELRCSPAGGSVSDPERLCELIGAHRSMVFPPRATGTCLGSPGIPPEVRVRGTFRGRAVELAVRDCDEPPARAEAATLWLRGLELTGGG